MASYDRTRLLYGLDPEIAMCLEKLNFEFSLGPFRRLSDQKDSGPTMIAICWYLPGVEVVTCRNDEYGPGTGIFVVVCTGLVVIALISVGFWLCSIF